MPRHPVALRSSAALALLLASCNSTNDSDELAAAGKGGPAHDAAVAGDDSASTGAPSTNAGRDSRAGTGSNAGSGGSSAAQAGADASMREPIDAAPVFGQPGCGFEAAAFCDTFDGPSMHRGRAGELDTRFWGGARMQGQLSTTRAMGIGMAVIPECRPGMDTHVWPDGDTLICDPTADIASSHLLVGAAAQNYGQNGYRIRQPFDFEGRTGKIVFDAALNFLSPLHGWVSLAITEDPISLPGYAIHGNDEGSIIPENAIEVHFANFGDHTRLSVRNIHFFENHVDTVYSPEVGSAPSFVPGKLNHYEIMVSPNGVQVTITPHSEDGSAFSAPEVDVRFDRPLPFTRGYVHLSVHNHAMLKYTQPDSHPMILDATVAQIDNVGFDGPVIERAREYEVPDALVKFSEPGFGDPYNPEDIGYDIAYVINDEAQGPKQTLRITGVDKAGATRAQLGFTVWVNFGQPDAEIERYTYRVRLNGHDWIDRVLTPEEVAFAKEGPTTVDPDGNPVGDPASQGRLAFLVDVPLEHLVDGDNTLEVVTANVPTGYPPLACNFDLVLTTE